MSHAKPDVLAFMPGVLLFVGLYTQILLLVFAALALAAALYKGASMASRAWGAIGILIGLLLGIAFWQPRPMVI